jgi:hypothetical protein
MQCDFCDRSEAACRPLVAGPGVSVCAECVRDLLGFLLDLEHVPLLALAPLDSGACGFCGRSELRHAVRFRGRRAVICAPCVAFGAEVLLDAEGATSELPTVLGAELRRRASDLARLYPDLAVRGESESAGTAYDPAT